MPRGRCAGKGRDKEVDAGYNMGQGLSFLGCVAVWVWVGVHGYR